MPFTDRVDAGRQLTRQLTHLRDSDVVVLGLPRGGVPVAFEVAQALESPLDVIMVRKLGVPAQPELAMGAIGEGDIRVINNDVLRVARVSAAELAAVERTERAELERRLHRFRDGRPAVSVRGRTAVIVDDGVATGSTAQAACQVARAQGAAQVVLAVPVASPRAVTALQQAADQVICVETPDWFAAIGELYDDFRQTTDDEVITLLARAAARWGGAEQHATGGDQAVDVEATVPVGPVSLPAHLTIPAGAPGIVVFAHGSGSSRHSPRNRYVAEILHTAQLGTLLFDLLTPDEERDRSNVFDVELLAARLVGAISWLRQQPYGYRRTVGLFGASTGAAAALWACAEPGTDVAAVVSRGGRPDLAASRLGQVKVPTLLIVGGLDQAVLRLNETARSQLNCENQLAVVPGATHLFEEPGTLRAAAELARDWFARFLSAG